jgi:hypothetical protein
MLRSVEARQALLAGEAQRAVSALKLNCDLEAADGRGLLRTSGDGFSPGFEGKNVPNLRRFA